MSTPYTVKPGDNLTKIAHAHGFSSWQEIYHHPDNADFRRRRPNPDRIYPGDVLLIPGRISPARGTVTPPSASQPIKPPNSPPIRLFLTPWEIHRLIQEQSLDSVASNLQRALKEIGPNNVSQSKDLDDLAKKVKRHMELNIGDYIIRPDYGTIFRGLKDLLKK